MILITVAICYYKSPYELKPYNIPKTKLKSTDIDQFTLQINRLMPRRAKWPPAHLVDSSNV